MDKTNKTFYEEDLHQHLQDKASERKQRARTGERKGHPLLFFS